MNLKKIMVSTRDPDTRVHTMWFYLYGIIERVKVYYVRKQNGCLGLRIKGTDCSRARRNIFSILTVVVIIQMHVSVKGSLPYVFKIDTFCCMYIKSQKVY